jgi:uncharacterized C2H2 Zn-finger protein
MASEEEKSVTSEEEELATYKKNYYRQNKDKIKEYYKTKIKCPTCNAIYARSSASHHKKTKKHLDALEDITTKYKNLKKKYYKLKYAEGNTN